MVKIQTSELCPRPSEIDLFDLYDCTTTETKLNTWLRFPCDLGQPDSSIPNCPYIWTLPSWFKDLNPTLDQLNNINWPINPPEILFSQLYSDLRRLNNHDFADSDFLPVDWSIDIHFNLPQLIFIYRIISYSFIIGFLSNEESYNWVKD